MQINAFRALPLKQNEMRVGGERGSEGEGEGESVFLNLGSGTAKAKITV